MITSHPGPRLGRGDDESIVVTAPAYVLTVDGSRAVLQAHDDDAARLELTLLAAVSRRDLPDESLVPAPGAGPIGVHTARQERDGIVVEVELPTAAWRRKTLHIEARADAVHLWVEVEGEGWITDVVLGGGAVLGGNGSCGELRSPIAHAGVFVPAASEPVAVVRPASTGAVLGVLGDALPGRLHGVFSPPPLAFAFSPSPAPASATEAPDGAWIGAAILGPVDELTFTRALYEPLDGGWWLRLTYEGHTRVTGSWRSPVLRLHPAGSVWEVLEDLRSSTRGTTATPVALGEGPIQHGVPAWWLSPIFCGWGSQCAEAARLVTGAAASSASSGVVGDDLAVTTVRGAPDLARQDRYDAWLDRLGAAGIVPGTIVLDDRWQAEYGACTVDAEKWPDLRGWIRARHARGQRVLLWFKAWDPGGIPARECVLAPDGTPVSVDPSNPHYLARLERIVTELLSPEGLDADGFKVDFTQRAPSGTSLRSAGDARPGGGVWGMAALHEMLRTLHDAARRAKPDALVVTHALDPRFADVTDMVRLNDVLERDVAGAVVPVVDQLRFRARVAQAALPGQPINTDQWPMPNLTQWRSYVAEQWQIGVPALYYVESMDRSDEVLEEADLALVADTWRRYGERKAP
ncbi:hypothetical protein [Salana multivorans]